MRVENEDELLLIAADEQLSSLEDVVRVMPTAQYLNVAFNCISCLSELEKMTELRSLDVSHNAVESLQEVATLSKLLVLKCSSNQIADLSWIAGLNYLEELWIRDNRIESAQLAYLQQLTALQTLVIHPNPCTEQDDYVFLKKKKNTHYQLPGSGKPKQRVKPKSAAVSLNAGPNPSLSFYQDQEYTVAYPNSTVTAIQTVADIELMQPIEMVS
ncbi:hypothetical protein JG687_00000573 [Phytophthora cactorum]|uniref:Uncharacterized protein n=1 Tax=Phytophthora cactorum TaxID=29920 RepID=A0A8T1V2B3_9STRA|nr:hypothetical protein JG687_00000573 [Phytophthora cactorum]